MSPSRVPPYLGRILDPDGEAVGTCFQITGGILVTAAHVLDDLAAVGEQVTVDPLGGATLARPRWSPSTWWPTSPLCG